jgi:hypothetical protein
MLNQPTTSIAPLSETLSPEWSTSTLEGLRRQLNDLLEQVTILAHEIDALGRRPPGHRTPRRQAASLPLQSLRLARGWSQAQTVDALRSIADVPLPDDLLNQYKWWERDRNQPGTFYRELLTKLFGGGKIEPEEAGHVARRERRPASH